MCVRTDLFDFAGSVPSNLYLGLKKPFSSPAENATALLSRKVHKNYVNIYVDIHIQLHIRKYLKITQMSIRLQIGRLIIKSVVDQVRG